MPVSQSSISGKAEQNATYRYAARFPELNRAFGELGSTHLTASHAGFGCYRVNDQTEQHGRALEAALTAGVNLIDTSSNYGDGHSEQLIATVLQRLISEGRIHRDEIILTTKGGYIQGQNYELARKHAADGIPFPDVVEYGEGLWHCIHPVFLSDQLNRSMTRMQVDHVDIYLLHNPEYYLNWSAKNGRSVEAARDEYYQRIHRAFVWLEEQVTAGKISYYGISSNTFPQSSSANDFTSLQHALALAESILPNHHFRVIQLPMNLFERGGIIERNQSDETESVITFAARHGLGVLINRPLNAAKDDAMIRLADFPVDESPDFDDVNNQIEKLAIMEGAFEQDILPDIDIGVEQKSAVKQTLTAGRMLKENWRRLGSIERWNNIQDQYIVARLNYGISLIEPALASHSDLQTWLQTYLEAVKNVLQNVNNVYRVMANQRSKQLHTALKKILPSSTHSLSLSQKAVLALRSVPGVSSVLIGMRQPSYVQDVIAGLQEPVLDNGGPLWQEFGSTLEAIEEL